MIPWISWFSLIGWLICGQWDVGRSAASSLGVGLGMVAAVAGDLAVAVVAVACVVLGGLVAVDAEVGGA